MKTAKDYAIDLANIQNTGDLKTMEELNSGVHANYAFKCVRKGDLKVSRFEYMKEIEEAMIKSGEKKPTNAWLENSWATTEMGKEEIRLDYEIDAMKAIMNAVKNHLVMLSIEKRG